MYYKLLFFTILLLTCIVSVSANECEHTIKIKRLESDKDRLIFSLLSLSVSKLTTKVCIASALHALPEGRLYKYVIENEYNLYWSSVDPTIEDELTPIRIPIFKGIQGYRIFLIRQGTQNLFDNVKKAKDLRRLLAGQGAMWADTEILTQAKIPVVTTHISIMLTEMLMKERFDYMPLAIHEPWQGINYWKDLPLSVEKNIVLQYPSAMFFYLTPNNYQLADLISQGMKLAIKDGSYEEMLYHSDMIQFTIKNANFHDRLVIHLENPGFHDKTPSEHLKYWFTPQQLSKYLAKPQLSSGKIK